MPPILVISTPQAGQLWRGLAAFLAMLAAIFWNMASLVASSTCLSSLCFRLVLVNAMTTSTF
jgi:hypothetical protein